MEDTAYLERGMPYFAFMYTNAVLVRKIDKLEMNVNKYPFTQRKRSDAH